MYAIRDKLRRSVLSIFFQIPKEMSPDTKNTTNAAFPSETEVFSKCEVANVSGHVKSQTKGRPRN